MGQADGNKALTCTHVLEGIYIFQSDDSQKRPGIKMERVC